MASTAACEFGAKEQTTEHVIRSRPFLIIQMEPCSIGCQEEPGDLADGNMSCHLGDRQAPFHFP